jgi:dCTP deaminase
MILSDNEIRAVCGNNGNSMIYPFHDVQVRWEDTLGRGYPERPQFNEADMAQGSEPTESSRAVISYGLGSFGYDIRVAGEFKLFTPTMQAQVDPKRIDERAFVNVVAKPGQAVVMPPNSFALARSMEYMRIPRDVTGIVVGKSTYARCGIVVNITPLEAGWHGEVTVEVSNTTPLPAVIYACEGIAQVLFFRGNAPDVSYEDRHGKYQGQRGVTLPRVG